MPCFESLLEYTHDTNCFLTPGIPVPFGKGANQGRLPSDYIHKDKQDEVVPGDLITTNGRIPEYRSSTVSLLTGVTSPLHMLRPRVAVRK